MVMVTTHTIHTGQHSQLDFSILQVVSFVLLNIDLSLLAMVIIFRFINSIIKLFFMIVVLKTFWFIILSISSLIRPVQVGISISTLPGKFPIINTSWKGWGGERGLRKESQKRERERESKNRVQKGFDKSLDERVKKGKFCKTVTGRNTNLFCSSSIGFHSWCRL